MLALIFAGITTFIYGMYLVIEKQTEFKKLSASDVKEEEDITNADIGKPLLTAFLGVLTAAGAFFILYDSYADTMNITEPTKRPIGIFEVEDIEIESDSQEALIEQPDTKLTLRHTATDETYVLIISNDLTVAYTLNFDVGDYLNLDEDLRLEEVEGTTYYLDRLPRTDSLTVTKDGDSD